MRSVKTVLTVIGAVTVLVLAGNTVALAATGKTFLLGRTNKAHKISTLKRTTAGPALNLVTSSSSAPLQVNGTGKVANLNADLVDGLDGASLQNRVIRYTLPASSGASVYQWHFTGLPAGTYLATYSIHTSTSGAASGMCWFLDPSAGTTRVMAGAVPGLGGTLTWNASGVFRTSEATDLTCDANASFTVDTSGGPTEVTFTPIDALSSMSATAVAP